MSYSIIIPVYNEQESIPFLLEQLESFSINNQILIINDGSTDGSHKTLYRCSFITYIRSNKNNGKGSAIRLGINQCLYEKVIITDGDLELKTSEIKNFMILDKINNIHFIIGSRYKKYNPPKSFWDYGNFIVTKFFNYYNNSELTDSLCCLKSFYKSDLNSLKSIGFDIDIEITSQLINLSVPFKVLPLSYKRRGTDQGKKLRLFDSWKIIYRIIFS